MRGQTIPFRPRISILPSLARRWVWAVLFGDRLALVLFLGTVLFVATYWRVGVFITDNFTTANTLVNVADGRLEITRFVYGPDSGRSPGMKIHDGNLYGRNYGLVILALPFLWALRAVAAVADARIVLAGLWCLGWLALLHQTGVLLDRRRAGALAGSALAIGLFALNLAWATPLAPRWLPLAALQLSTMVWAGLIAVVTYRLTRRVYDRRIGAFAGGVAVVATPVGFWASIPKRHVLMGMFAMVTVYCFYRSRAAAGGDLRFRALAYAAIGVSAWVFPIEALLMALALGPLDLLTARSNGPRRLAAVGVAFGLSLLPFLLTNVAITGDPLRPPGMLPRYGASGSGTGGGTAASTPVVPGLLGALLAPLELLYAKYLTAGVSVAFHQPDRLVEMFVRSGYVERAAPGDGGEAINLALLESMPLLGALAALPVLALRRRHDRQTVRAWLASPVGQTDVLVGLYVLLMGLVYIPRLPIHAMVTVRYLVPAVPGLVYLLIRLAPVRTAVRGEARTLAVAYAALVAIGGQLLLLAVIVQRPALGEAVQLHALLGLAIAVPLAGWTAVARGTDRDVMRVGAVLLALAAASISVFLLLSGLLYFAYAGEFALPISQALWDALSGIP